MKYHYMYKAIFFFLLFIYFFLAISITNGVACTVWAATGKKVGMKGTIIAKNRDNSPNLYTVPRLLFPEKGYRVFGLFDTEADGYITGGINEKGLAVFNASPVSVPKEKRHVATEDTTERLLVSYGSVRDVLKDLDVFSKSHPALYMLSDPLMIAIIEVAPGGKVAIQQTEDGVLAFTNHYTDSRLSNENKINTPGSRARLARIRNYMFSTKKPFNISDFISISEDRDGGPDHAIWRTGSSREKIRTLAGFILAIPEYGMPEIYIRLANPDEEERVLRGGFDFSLMTVSPD